MCEPTIRPLLDGAVSWLLAHLVDGPGGRTMPSFVAPGAQPPPARSAWCYGDPGVAVALLLAGRDLDEPAWQQAGVELALRAGRRLPEQSGVTDAGFCHGAAGLGHLFQRMYQLTGEEELAGAATFWIDRTLAMCDAAAGGAGSDPAPVPWQGPGLLEGAAGIALVLLAACEPAEPGLGPGAAGQHRAADAGERAVTAAREPRAAGFFVLRTPLLPLTAVTDWARGLEAAGRLDEPDFEDALAADRAQLRARLDGLVTDAAFREALFLAAPTLAAATDQWRKDPDSDRGKRAENSLVAYLMRAAARPTPFGLFAGCTTGSIGQATRLRLAGRASLSPAHPAGHGLPVDAREGDRG